MADSISVADLLAPSAGVEWFEAVALVREVCAILLGESAQPVGTPEPSQILVAANGKMSITGVAHGDAPVRRLGQLLLALLRSSEPPVTLRLVLSEAMSAPPVYGTVAELDAALAYFERPDRAAVLRGLFAKGWAVQGSAGAAEPQELDDLAPLPAARSEVIRADRRQSQKRVAMLATVAGVLALASIVGYQQRARWISVVSPDVITTAGHRASAAVDKAVFSSVSAVTEMTGMGKLMPPGTAVPADVPVPPPPPAPSARRHRAAGDTTVGGLPIRIFDLQPPPIAQRSDALMVARTEAADALARVSDVTPAAHPADLHLYGPDDHEVQAPLAIRPHLPNSLPAGISAAQLARIELVISADGTVQAVKLVPGERPVTVTETMLLSAAKAWRFAPAMRDGRAVRYRKTVLLSER